MGSFAEIQISAMIFDHLPAIGASACAFVSFILILKLWLNHPQDPILKKLRWSILLCVPFLGWVFYGAFYTPLAENDVKAAITPGITGIR